MPFGRKTPSRARAARVDLEHERRETVAAGVELDGEAVALAPGVAPGEMGADPGGGVVGEPGADVERVATEQHPDIGRLGRRRALVGIALGQAGGRIAAAHAVSSRTPSSRMPAAIRAAATVGTGTETAAADPDGSGVCAESGRCDSAGGRRGARPPPIMNRRPRPSIR